MKAQTTYPRVSSVHPLPERKLEVGFSTGEVRIYDCRPLMGQPPFRPLEDEALFRSVHADPHGYAVIWNDEIDLAESELWVNSTPVKPARPSAADDRAPLPGRVH